MIPICLILDVTSNLSFFVDHPSLLVPSIRLITNKHDDSVPVYLLENFSVSILKNHSFSSSSNVLSSTKRLNFKSSLARLFALNNLQNVLQPLAAHTRRKSEDF